MIAKPRSIHPKSSSVALEYQNQQFIKTFMGYIYKILHEPNDMTEKDLQMKDQTILVWIGMEITG